jgi:hypothetical protein
MGSLWGKGKLVHTVLKNYFFFHFLQLHLHSTSYTNTKQVPSNLIPKWFRASKSINTSSTRGLSGYRACRRVADSWGPVLVPCLSLDWETVDQLPNHKVLCALVRAEGVNGTWVLCP